MKRFILAFLALAAPAIAAPIDDAKYLLAQPAVTTALKAIPGQNYVWARDTVLGALGSPVSVPPPVPAPTPTPTPTPSPVPPPSAGVAISGQTALLNALSGARGGETFTLADGSYSFGLTDKRYPAMVTVVGGRGAKGRPFKLTRVSNLTIKGPTINGSAGMNDAYAVIELAATDHVVLSDLLLMGVDGTGLGVFARDGSNSSTTLRNIEIAKLSYGAVIRGGSDWLIEGAKVHDLSNDGFQISSTTNLTLRDSSLYDFRPKSGAHLDAVQLTYPTINTTLERIKVRGDMQGLFYDGRLGRQKNLRVIGNDVMVSYPNAIRFDDADGFVSGNVVTKGGQYTPIIRLNGMTSDGTNRVDGRAW